jgi:hypothetical protein
VSHAPAQWGRNGGDEPVGMMGPGWGPGLQTGGDRAMAGNIHSGMLGNASGQVWLRPRGDNQLVISKNPHREAGQSQQHWGH